MPPAGSWAVDACFVAGAQVFEARSKGACMLLGLVNGSRVGVLCRLPRGVGAESVSLSEASHADE